MELDTLHPDKTYTTKELSQYFRVHPDTFRARIKQYLPFYAIIWFKKQKKIYYPGEIELIKEAFKSLEPITND